MKKHEEDILRAANNHVKKYLNTRYHSVEMHSYMEGAKDFMSYKIREENVFSERSRVIGVISLDTQDFRNWKLECNLKHDGLEYPKKFKVGNTSYIGISSVYELCSISFDSIIETKNAKMNKDYEQIKYAAKASCIVPEIKINMKTPEEWSDRLINNQIGVIKEIQKDAWNAALDAAAENAEVEEKLGNPYDINSAYWEVDKQSILKLKK